MTPWANRAARLSHSASDIWATSATCGRSLTSGDRESTDDESTTTVPSAIRQINPLNEMSDTFYELSKRQIVALEKSHFVLLRNVKSKSIRVQN